MKTTRFLLTLLALGCALAVATAQADDTAKVKKATKTTAKYDTDKDGMLSADEQAVMKAEKAKAKAERKERAKAKDTAAGATGDTPK